MVNLFKKPNLIRKIIISVFLTVRNTCLKWTTCKPSISMGNTLLEKQHMNNEIELANTVINLLVLLLEEFAGPCWRADTIYFLITPSKCFCICQQLLCIIYFLKTDQSMFLHTVSLLAFSQIMRAETPWTEGKQQHGTLQGISFIKPAWVTALLYLAFCRYIFSQTKIIISHVRHGDKIPFSAGAAGIKEVLLNGTGLPQANCGPRIKLCRHPKMRYMWRPADEISWKACSMASILGNKYPKLSPTRCRTGESLFFKQQRSLGNRTLRINSFRKTL